jgi:DNA-binding CsgD family transcriptional regulator
VLRGRSSECAAFDEMIAAVRVGESRTLVIRGEAGVGKTALVEYLLDAASDLRVVRAVGVESEMELPFAALHQLCAPLLEHLGRLPAPQREALRIVFGLNGGAAPDPFLVGLAVLSLLSEVAEERPLVCVVDDAQWLDQASARTLGFVARRLRAEPVGVVFAAREPGDELRGLPELAVQGLGDGDARALLDAVVVFVLDERVRDRIVAETRGNPLALLELPRGLSATQLAGGFGLPSAEALSGRIEESFRERLDALPCETERLLLVAAAEPVGDPLLVWRAAERLGIGPWAAAAAEAEGLLAIGQRVTFRHPLVRSAVYRSAPLEERRAVHRALAEVTDPSVDPDRRAWHLAAAAPGPDEDVAQELERSAGRARARGGLAAAAAFLQRAVALTREPARRVNRALLAAQTSLQAGAFDVALGLLATAEAGALNEFQRARLDLLRGQIASATGAGCEAPGQLLKAAARFEPLDVTLARETYLDAWGAALFAGRLARAGGSLLEVSQAAKAAPRPAYPPRPPDLLLDGLALAISDGRPVAAPTLGRAVRAFGSQRVSAEQALRWGVLASAAAVTLWDFESWGVVSTRQIELARGAGALGLLSVALAGQGMVLTWRGEFEAAETLSLEADAVTEATGTRIAPYGAMLLAAFRGREGEASRLTETTVRDALLGGEGLGVELARWTTAILYNGLGRYEEALTAAEDAADAPGLFIPVWALVELIEAASRSGNARAAAEALERLAEATSSSNADWAVGIEARSRALLSEGEVAEGLHREAIDRLGRTRLRPELARAHLLYGEWLRRENRRLDVREQLRLAYDAFATMGADGFADRARRELLASGERVRRRREDTRDELTPQEERIARLAREGLSNPDIGSRLFISPRTVEWHLHKVFGKLGISSRRGLREALPSRDRHTTPV